MTSRRIAALVVPLLLATTACQPATPATTAPTPPSTPSASVATGWDGTVSIWSGSVAPPYQYRSTATVSGRAVSVVIDHVDPAPDETFARELTDADLPRLATLVSSLGPQPTGGCPGGRVNRLDLTPLGGPGVSRSHMECGGRSEKDFATIAQIYEVLAGQPAATR